MRRSYSTILLLLLTASAAQAQSGLNSIASDGTVAVPAFNLPPSIYLSPEAKASLPRQPRDGGALLDSCQS